MKRVLVVGLVAATALVITGSALAHNGTIQNKWFWGTQTSYPIMGAWHTELDDGWSYNHYVNAAMFVGSAPPANYCFTCPMDVKVYDNSTTYCHTFDDGDATCDFGSSHPYTRTFCHNDSGSSRYTNCWKGKEIANPA